MQENCGPDNDEYQKSHITPQNGYGQRPDRSHSALPIATLREAYAPFSRMSIWQGRKHLAQNLLSRSDAHIAVRQKVPFQIQNGLIRYVQVRNVLLFQFVVLNAI